MAAEIDADQRLELEHMIRSFLYYFLIIFYIYNLYVVTFFVQTDFPAHNGFVQKSASTFIRDFNAVRLLYCVVFDAMGGHSTIEKIAV